MAIPTVVGVGTVAAATTGDITPTRHASTTTDDCVFIAVEQSAVNTFASAPTGYALVTNCQQKVGSTATDGNIQVFWKRVAGGDGDPTITGTPNHTSGRIITVRGCIASGNPWDVTTGGTDATANTSLSIPGTSTTVDECLILTFFGTGPDISSTTEVSGWANGNQDNLAEQMDNWNTNGNGGGFGCVTGEKATAGDYGTTTATLVTSSNKAYCTIALKPPTPTTGQPTVKRMGGVANVYSNNAQGSKVW